jgi:hypothetical protein
MQSQYELSNKGLLLPGERWLAGRALQGFDSDHQSAYSGTGKRHQLQYSTTADTPFMPARKLLLMSTPFSSFCTYHGCQALLQVYGRGRVPTIMA